jgi:outer membrane protein assembly factor BamA
LDSLGNYANSFEQSGEILFESSIELRHEIIGFLYGGLFIDAGNTWTLRNDDSRPGSQFDFNRFYKENAVCAGYDLRFDFSFLLLRFDAGFKIYDPSGGPNRQFIWDNGFDDPGYVNYKRLVWNIGIGYPF